MRFRCDGTEPARALPRATRISPSLRSQLGGGPCNGGRERYVFSSVPSGTVVVVAAGRVPAAVAFGVATAVVAVPGAADAVGVVAPDVETRMVGG